MTQAETFYRANIGYAKTVQKESGVNAGYMLAQAAFETGYGKYMPKNNYFGFKAQAGYAGKKGLYQTFEYHSSPNVKAYPVILKIEKVGNLYKYTVKDWFRQYDSPLDGFRDYAKLIVSIYPQCLKAVSASDYAYKLVAGKYKYYTADPAEYAKNLASIYKAFNISGSNSGGGSSGSQSGGGLFWLLAGIGLLLTLK